MAVIVVTDTHALMWYAQGRAKKLGPDARRVYERADEGRATIFVPTLALVEVAEAVRAGRISLPGGFGAWTDRLLSTRHFLSADLTWEIVRRAETLVAIPERGDRLIGATAAHLECPLLTRDPEIAAAAGVETVW